MKRIPVAGPWITEREIDYVNDAVRNAWYDQANTYHVRFESAFAHHTGRQFAMALPSCTSAIHLALASLGIGPGDEVIVPEATWIATAAPISYVGATPVFADIDPSSWCLSPDSARRHITPKTRAIIAVDLYGNMAAMPELEALAAQHNVWLIEDAAQAAGGRLDSRPAGAFGKASVFSFHGSKTLTTGEGGMLLTDDPALFRRAGILRDHGRLPGDRRFFNAEVAYKYKMSAMQAALGLAQLERLEELIARKREIFAWYREILGVVEGVTLNAEPAGHRNVFWMVTAVFDASTGMITEEVQSELDAAGIDSRPFFHPLSSLPAYAGAASAAIARQENRVAYSMSPRAINLPSALSLTRDDVERVCEVLTSIMDRRRTQVR